MKALIHTLLVPVFALLLVTACSDDRPDDIPGDAEMEAVLYDYHMADALGQTAPDSVAYYKQQLRREALAAHGMSEEAFQNALRWYSRHSEKLYVIYGRLSERLSGSLSIGGATEGGGDTGDTLTLWQGKGAYLLTADTQNYMDFTLAVDTTVKSGDRLSLTLTPSWMYSEGSRSAIATLAIEYEGDSVQTATAYLSGMGTTELSLMVGTPRVRSVSGFAYQVARPSERPKLLIISRPVLLRYRSREAAPGGAAAVQPVGVNRELSIRDSLLRDDTLARRRSHFIE